MKTLANTVFALAVFLICSNQAKGEPSELVYTSPSGALRIEQPAGSYLTSVVLTADPTQRASLPNETADSPNDDEFHCSPDDQWMLGLRQAGSGLKDGTLYHILTPLQVELVTSGKSFDELAWENAVKLGVVKSNYLNDGVYEEMFFECWSCDSGRLLIELRGGEEKRSMEGGLLYFNVRTKKFELTDYLRKVNHTKSRVIACAEPIDPIPAEADLKAQFERLDSQLNKVFGEMVAKLRQEAVSTVRDDERAWIKARDVGTSLYVSLFPAAERERRRLQFLNDVTAARIEALPIIGQIYS